MNRDYYSRPSLSSSTNIAITCAVILMLLLTAEGVWRVLGL